MNFDRALDGNEVGKWVMRTGSIRTYGLASRSSPLDTRSGDFLSVCASTFSKAVVHQTVAETDGIFGFGERHFGARQY